MPFVVAGQDIALCLRFDPEVDGDPDAAVHFVASGTLANIISIASCLRPHEAVIAAGSAGDADDGEVVIASEGFGEVTVDPAADPAEEARSFRPLAGFEVHLFASEREPVFFRSDAG